MSSILDAIAVEQAAFRKGPTCSAGMLLDALPAAERDDVNAALLDNGIPYTVLSRALGKVGHKVGAETLRRHRKGDCACAKP